MSPSRWPEVATTKEEKFLFVALTIDPDKVWRSAEGLAREMGWPPETVADMFDRFADTGLIVQNPANPKLYAYWERAEIERQNGTGKADRPDSRP